MTTTMILFVVVPHVRTVKDTDGSSSMLCCNVSLMSGVDCGTFANVTYAGIGSRPRLLQNGASNKSSERAALLCSVKLLLQ